MTYAGKEEAWLAGIIQASHVKASPQPAAEPAAPLGTASSTFHDPRYAGLLSRLMALPSKAPTPCIMFIACDGSDGATAPAMGTAQAAASLLGRSLLLDARLNRIGPAQRARADTPHGTPIPDAFMPRLYHRALSHNASDIALLFGTARAEALAALASPFRFVAIEAPPPASGPAAAALAPCCGGVVLVVSAGRCCLNAVKSTAAQIIASGGHVVGSILSGAPADLPRWMRA